MYRSGRQINVQERLPEVAPCKLRNQIDRLVPIFGTT